MAAKQNTGAAITAATATFTPGPPGPGAEATAAGTGRDDFARWEHQLTGPGGCLHPVRLAGRIEAIDRQTGETRTVYSTEAEPGGVLLTPCGNRRESVCPPCSDVYKQDARQLVSAGLAGGKGIPETITAHPCVFATFTAPSFGPVHARRKRGKTILPCRPRRDASQRRCPHGRDISCARRHFENDPRLGQPLCPDCFDYQAAVIFNLYAGTLWRRFVTYLPRHLARLAGITQKQFRAQARVRYVKVAEYQARGVVHYHAVIRLDAPGEDYQPPPAAYTAALLCQAIEDAAAAVRLDLAPDDDHPALPALTLRFGNQTDTKVVRPSVALPGTGRALSSQAVANYIAKYATKTLTAPGLPDHRIRDEAELDKLTCSRHYRQLISTAWRLGTRHAIAIRAQRPPLAGSDSSASEAARAWQPLEQAAAEDEGRLCKWAHTLGYGGHFLTKSRRYSVTFGQLRAARREHRRAQRHPDGERDPWDRPLDDTVVLIRSSWQVTAASHHSHAEADLARAAAARARAHEPWAAQAA